MGKGNQMSLLGFFKRKSTNGSIKIIINNTISILENNNKYKSEDEIISKINKFTNNISLAWELYWLIPMAFTRLIALDAAYSNEVILCLANGKQVKRQLSDFIVYKSIMGVVLKRVSKKSKRKSEKLEAILFLSSEYNTIHNSIKNGNKMENLVLSPVMLFAPDNYIIK